MALRERLESEAIRLSVHVVCELLAGAELSGRRAEERQRVFRFCEAVEIAYPDDRFAPVYARVQAALQRAGHVIGTMDLLIATAAIVDQAPLVTRNRDEFRRVPGLDVIGY